MPRKIGQVTVATANFILYRPYNVARRADAEGKEVTELRESLAEKGGFEPTLGLPSVWTAKNFPFGSDMLPPEEALKFVMAEREKIWLSYVNAAPKDVITPEMRAFAHHYCEDRNPLKPLIKPNLADCVFPANGTTRGQQLLPATIIVAKAGGKPQTEVGEDGAEVVVPSAYPALEDFRTEIVCEEFVFFSESDLVEYQLGANREGIQTRMTRLDHFGAATKLLAGNPLMKQTRYAEIVGKGGLSKGVNATYPFMLAKLDSRFPKVGIAKAILASRDASEFVDLNDLIFENGDDNSVLVMYRRSIPQVFKDAFTKSIREEDGNVIIGLKASPSEQAILDLIGARAIKGEKNNSLSANWDAIPALTEEEVARWFAQFRKTNPAIPKPASKAPAPKTNLDKVQDFATQGIKSLEVMVKHLNAPEGEATKEMTDLIRVDDGVRTLVNASSAGFGIELSEITNAVYTKVAPLTGEARNLAIRAIIALINGWEPEAPAAAAGEPSAPEQPAAKTRKGRKSE